jgi:hypothetical protein
MLVSRTAASLNYVTFSALSLMVENSKKSRKEKTKIT